MEHLPPQELKAVYKHCLIHPESNSFLYKVEICKS